MSILNTIIAKGISAGLSIGPASTTTPSNGPGEQGNKYSGNGDIFKNYKFQRISTRPAGPGKIRHNRVYRELLERKHSREHLGGQQLRFDCPFCKQCFAGKESPNLYTSLPHPVFQIPVTYQAGNVKAVGYRGAWPSTHDAIYAGNPVKIILKPDYSTLVADGSDMTRVYVAVADQNDQPVPQASASVTFSVTGTGVFLGENHWRSKTASSFSFKPSSIKPAPFPVRATASGLPTGSATIQVQDFIDPVVPGPDVGIVWNAARPATPERLPSSQGGVPGL